MKLSGIKSAESCHDDSIWAAAWLPSDSGGLLLTGSLDESVRAWAPDDLSSAAPPSRGHSLGVVALAAHPSAPLAAAASLDSLVRVFDVHTAASLALLESPPSEAWGLHFHPKGSLLAVAGGGSASLKLWDTSSWLLADTLPVPRPDGARPDRPPASGTPSGNFVLAVAWSPDGRRLACSSFDGSVAVFDVARAKLLHHLPGHHMPVRSLVFSPADPRVLFTASDDSHVHMYDADGKALVAAMSGHSAWVSCIDASPDGAALATGSADRTVRLWDLGMRAAVQTMATHTDHVWGVAFRPDSRGAGRLASVSDDRTISLYDYS